MSLFAEHCFCFFIAGAPSEPRNLKTETVFNKKSAKTYIRLQWDPPDKTGGSKIEKYLIEYIVNGLAWGSPDTEETQGTEFEGLKLQNGGKYNARVRAQNKAGLGLPSNEVLIDLGRFLVKHNLGSG